MNELLWLLLPIAAFSGWLIAYRSYHARYHAPASLSSDYFRGLNYLLNEQPDKAIEVFIRMAEVDNETVEMHLALGNLFRRRGEVDRAIRIHQNLIARPSLNHAQRTHALLELGEDYMRAGLFDRAENLFLELVDIGAHRQPAYRHLIDIYQQEQDWEKAIEACRKLEEAGGGSMQHVIAQYYCELAEQALGQGEDSRGQAMLKKALSHDRNCVRATMIQGNHERRNGNLRAAIKTFKRVADQDIEFVPEIIAPLRACFMESGDPKGMSAYLHELRERYAGISAMTALAEQIAEERGEDAAVEFMMDYLSQRPSVRGLAWLIDVSLKESRGEARQNLNILQEVTQRVLAGKPIYACHQCGFSGRSMHWQCPSCKNWNTVKPIQGVEGE